MTKLSRSARPKTAAAFLDIGLSTFWRYTKRADFPKARRLSPGVTVFDLHELAAWRDKQGAA